MQDTPISKKATSVMVTHEARNAFRNALAKKYGGDMHGHMIAEATIALLAHATKLSSESQVEVKHG